MTSLHVVNHYRKFNQYFICGLNAECWKIYIYIFFFFYQALSAGGHQCWWMEYRSQSVWNIFLTLPVFNDSSPFIFRVPTQAAFVPSNNLQAVITGCSVIDVYRWLNCFHQGSMSNINPYSCPPAPEEGVVTRSLCPFWSSVSLYAPETQEHIFLVFCNVHRGT